MFESFEYGPEQQMATKKDVQNLEVGSALMFFALIMMMPKPEPARPYEELRTMMPHHQ